MLFTLDCCDLKIEVFCSYLQHYGTTQAMRLNCSNLKILPDVIVTNGIKNYYCITLICSINCVTFLVLWIRNYLSSGAKPGVFPQIWDFTAFLGF